jgi:PAS domain S-box-containing protein
MSGNRATLEDRTLPNELFRLVLELSEPKDGGDILRRLIEAANKMYGAPLLRLLGDGEQDPPVTIPIRTRDRTFGRVAVDRDLAPDDDGFLPFLEDMARTLAVIMERMRRVEPAFQASDEFFRLMSEQSLLGVCIVQDDRIKYANQRLADIAGLPLETFLGWNPMQFLAMIHPEDRNMVAKQLQRKQRGKGDVIPNYQIRIFRSSGEVAWLDISSKTVYYSGKPADLVALIDITDSKRKEAQRIRLAAAVEQTAEMIIVADAEGVIQYVNPAFESIMGYRGDEVVGQSGRILQGREGRAAYDEVGRTLAAGRPWSGRLVQKDRGGKEHEVDATVSPVKDASGRLVNYISVQRDITRKVALENRIRQATKMEAVGRLAGGIAHDFNNQLTVIKGYCELLLRDLPSGGPLRCPLEEILAATKRSASLVSQLLAFSRRQVLHEQVVSLSHIVRALADPLSRMLGHDIRLNIPADGDPGYVQVDPAQLENAIVNLAANARDAMPQGGTLTIETRNVRRAPETSGEGAPRRPHVLLEVSDTGEGMDKETLDHVFEPFFTTKPLGQGSGLGLPMVYGFVRQSGGQILAESAPGRGTTFWIYLPRVDPPPQCRGGTG